MLLNIPANAPKNEWSETDPLSGKPTPTAQIRFSIWGPLCASYSRPGQHPPGHLLVHCCRPSEAPLGSNGGSISDSQPVQRSQSDGIFYIFNLSPSSLDKHSVSGSPAALALWLLRNESLTDVERSSASAAVWVKTCADVPTFVVCVK